MAAVNVTWVGNVLSRLYMVVLGPGAAPGELQRWLKDELPGLELAARDWPGRPIRASLLDADELVMVIEFTPVDDASAWKAEVVEQRASSRRGPSAAAAGAHLRFAAVGVAGVGRLKIDRIAGRVWVGRRRCKVTRRDVEFLWRLAQEPGKEVSYGTLLHELWGSDGSHIRVTALAQRLRRKLGPHGDMIETVYGIGFRLRARAAGQTARVPPVGGRPLGAAADSDRVQQSPRPCPARNQAASVIQTGG